MEGLRHEISPLPAVWLTGQKLSEMRTSKLGQEKIYPSFKTNIVGCGRYSNTKTDEQGTSVAFGNLNLNTFQKSVTTANPNPCVVCLNMSVWRTDSSI